MKVALEGATLSSLVSCRTRFKPQLPTTRARFDQGFAMDDGSSGGIRPGSSAGSRSTGAQDTAVRKGVRRQPKRVARTAQSAPK
jgi:hypothetical protein